MLAPVLSLLAADLRSRGIAPRTVAAYTRIIRPFVDQRSDLESLNRLDVAEWIYSADTESKQRHRYLAMNALCRALVDEGSLASNPCAQVKMPVEAESPQPSLTDEAFRRLLATCDARTLIGKRDRAIIETLGSTGCRVAELAAMSVDDVDLDAAQILIRNPKKERSGKARMRLIYLNDDAVKALASWMRVRAPRATASALWTDARGRGVTSNGVQQMVARRGERIGLRVSPHQFRRRLASNWLLYGLSESGLMAMGGWKSPTMPSRYAAGSLAEIARADHQRLNCR